VTSHARDDALTQDLGLEMLRQQNWRVWHTAKRSGHIVASASLPTLIRKCQSIDHDEGENQ
jgi:hypothetical protein